LGLDLIFIEMHFSIIIISTTNRYPILIISPADKFGEISRLVEFIPIAADFPSSGRFIEGAHIDTDVHLQESSRIIFKEMGLQLSIPSGISFRDIVKLLEKYLKEASWQVMVTEQRYNQLKEIGCSYPITYLLFDFCLTALDGDYLDSRLFLSHAHHILGLNKSFSLLLSVIVNEELVEDSDVRKFLTALAKVTEPPNAELYLDMFGNGFRTRYNSYQNELKK
jgi:hypothetical protein